MTVIYVSDVLENVLEAQNTRHEVRHFCQVILNGVPTSVQPVLKKCLHYIAGKCMGYPSVWFVRQALEMDKAELAAALEQATGPLLISLTTSITDDYLDGDDKMTPGHMMLVYLLIFEALRRPHWFEGGQEKIFLNEIYPLIPGFVHEGKTRACQLSPEELQVAANRSGRRIGAFHETIAFAMANRRAPKQVHRQLVKLAGRFGDWCSLLDDIFDIEVDIDAGANATLPIVILRNWQQDLGQAIDARDSASCAGVIQSAAFRQTLVREARARLDLLQSDARDAGFARLADELRQASLRVEEQIQLHRAMIDAARQADAPRAVAV